MNTKCNIEYSGIVIPLAAHHAAVGDPIDLNDDDICRMEGVHPLYRAMRATLGNQLSVPQLVGAEIRMFLVASHHGQVAYSPSQMLADLQLTAAELIANAARDQPRRHSKALSHVGLGKVLHALSSANRKADTRLLVHTGAGVSEVPVLEPGAFLEPAREDQHRQTGSYLVTGLLRHHSRGCHGILIGENELPVALPQADSLWNWESVRSALEMPTHFVGTVARSDKSSAWMPEPGARLEVQQFLADIVDTRVD